MSKRNVERAAVCVASGGAGALALGIADDWYWVGLIAAAAGTAFSFGLVWMVSRLSVFKSGAGSA